MLLAASRVYMDRLYAAMLIVLVARCCWDLRRFHAQRCLDDSMPRDELARGAVMHSKQPMIELLLDSATSIGSSLFAQ